MAVTNQISPILKMGTVWKLRSPLDSWTYLSKFVTKTNLDALFTNWEKVIGEIDPKFTLGPANMNEEIKIHVLH